MLDRYMQPGEGLLHVFASGAMAVTPAEAAVVAMADAALPKKPVNQGALVFDPHERRDGFSRRHRKRVADGDDLAGFRHQFDQVRAVLHCLEAEMPGRIGDRGSGKPARHHIAQAHPRGRDRRVVGVPGDANDRGRRNPHAAADARTCRRRALARGRGRRCDHRI